MQEGLVSRRQQVERSLFSMQSFSLSDEKVIYGYKTLFYLHKFHIIWVAAIAPWFCLCLPSCGPGFESQAVHLCFFQFVIDLWCEKDENKQKEAGIGPYFF